MQRQIHWREIHQIDMVSYLEGLGFQPQKARGNEYWYCSPLRSERTPSFKVDRARNIWYDHGIGKGGTLIDFGLLFHRCSIRELPCVFFGREQRLPSFSPSQPPALDTPGESPASIQLLRVGALSDSRLLCYAASRKISLAIARKYLHQVHFQVRDHTYLTLGFRNSAGGYELRSRSFKGSSSPKASTFIQKEGGAGAIAVFEGFFSFLSYLQLTQKSSAETAMKTAPPPAAFLVLNSVSLLEKNRELMERHERVHLYLDRDAAGFSACEKAMGWSTKYQDRSSLYREHKDLNDYLCCPKSLRESCGQQRGRREGRLP
jgi:hypothetical protein